MTHGSSQATVDAVNKKPRGLGHALLKETVFPKGGYRKMQMLLNQKVRVAKRKGGYREMKIPLCKKTGPGAPAVLEKKQSFHARGATGKCRCVV